MDPLRVGYYKRYQKLFAEYNLGKDALTIASLQVFFHSALIIWNVEAFTIKVDIAN